MAIFIARAGFQFSGVVGLFCDGGGGGRLLHELRCWNKDFFAEFYGNLTRCH